MDSQSVLSNHFSEKLASCHNQLRFFGECVGSEDPSVVAVTKPNN